MVSRRRALVSVVGVAMLVAAHAGGVRVPRDSPATGRGRIPASPPVAGGGPAPSPKPARPGASCTPLLGPDPGYRPMWVPESSCWGGRGVERTPGHWIWSAP
jgi:hypothetical protein